MQFCMGDRHNWDTAYVSATKTNAALSLVLLLVPFNPHSQPANAGCAITKATDVNGGRLQMFLNAINSGEKKIINATISVRDNNKFNGFSTKTYGNSFIAALHYKRNW